MNYFELFELPVSLRIKPEGLSAKYFALSRKYHPDYFTQFDESAQAEALDISAQVNKAYKIFRNADSTLKYVLELKGLLQEEEKYALSPDFLMEVMELNEGIMELSFEPDPAKKQELTNQVQTLQQQIKAHVEPILENYQEGVTSEKELLQVKEYYYRKKYLDRMVEELGKGE